MSLKVNLVLDFSVAGQTIVLEAPFDKENPSHEFRGKMLGLNLKLTDILEDLLNRLSSDKGKELVPEGFLPDLELRDIYVSYKTATKEINCIASTEIEGKETQFLFHYKASNGKAKSRYAFGIRTNISDLSGLPMVGQQMKGLTITGLGFTYTSFDKTIATDNAYPLPYLSGTGDNKLIASADPKILNRGMNFSGEVNLPLLSTPFSLSIPVDKNENQSDTRTMLAKPGPAKNTLSASTKWFKLNKKMGPLSIGQLGFRYKDRRLYLLISAEVGIAALTISLNGLGVGFEISKLFKKDFSPTFSLDGIGIAYSAPPIEVSAAFLRTQEIYDGKQIDVYNGAAIIKASKFTISAIGSYANVNDQASLFIYGLYDGPIGGPSFFFVTGIAAGFGYNRRVNVPSIEEVEQFPLVSLAMNPASEKGGLSGVLNSLNTPMKNGKKPIEISLGDYWLAVGIKFTSFKIIESFVLLTVNFGTRLEFAILGLSKLSWPEKSINPDPIVYIELAISAHFGPDSDVISVDAFITPDSYLLSKKCKLSGGFAFYTWVQGPHEGDFVITIGGYHPKFIKPAHYPTVPRLSLSWKISDQLSIHGEMYYALTASSIMAGGKWEILFSASVVRASIILWADMLIFWAPFQYTIDLGITIKIEASIKIWFIRIHFNFEMSAQLHIWGPPFAGEVYVDWSIFSFTIPFGSHSKKVPEKLTWSEFSTGFVPQKKVGLGSDPINLSISNGLIDVKGKNKFPIINAHQLAISVDSFIPLTELEVNASEVSANTLLTSALGDRTYADREKKIGILPCGFVAGEVDMKMSVSLTLEEKMMDMSFTCSAKGVAEALWGAKETGSNNANPGTAKVIPNVLSGLTLRAPIIPPVSQIRTFDFSKLVDRSEASFEWNFTHHSLGEAYHAYDVLGYYNKKKVEGTLQKTYEPVLEKRERILALLQTGFDNSLPEIQEIEMNKIMESGKQYFKAAPVLCGIGQIPQYSTDVN